MNDLAHHSALLQVNVWAMRKTSTTWLGRNEYTQIQDIVSKKK